jgi:hypothetical protein
VIPGDLVGDGGSPLYGTAITNLDLTFVSTEDLTGQTFEVGSFFGAPNSLGFSFSFAASPTGGGVLSITFTNPIILPCTIVPDDGSLCANLDLLVHIDGTDDDPLPFNSTVRVTQVNDVAVPEPATLSMLGVVLAVAAVRRRRTIESTKSRRAFSTPGSADPT